MSVWKSRAGTNPYISLLVRYSWFVTQNAVVTSSQMLLALSQCYPCTERRRHTYASGKHEGHLWASLGSLERPKDFKDTETAHLSGDRYIFFQRHGHL